MSKYLVSGAFFLLYVILGNKDGGAIMIPNVWPLAESRYAYMHQL